MELMVNVGRPTALRRLAAARCLLLPLRWREPFGMVMIEAMALGVPVVALRRGSVPEVVADGITGFVCDTPEELPDALKRVGDLDPQACRDRVRDHFSAEVMARRYEQVYRAAIAARPGSGARVGPAAARAATLAGRPVVVPRSCAGHPGTTATIENVRSVPYDPGGARPGAAAAGR